MHDPIAIEPGDDTHAYGVGVPDLSGCFSAGDDLDEALSNAVNATFGWMEATLDREGEIPRPSTLASSRAAHPKYRNWVWAVVTIDPVAFDNTVEQVNITLPRRIFRRLNEQAKAAAESRSGYIAKLALSQRD